MGSNRLPGKVLMEAAGVPLVAHTLRRLRAAERLDDIVLATSHLPADDALVDLARTEGVGCHRGSEQDVLRRMCDAAREADAGLVVRITADCPLVDPAIVDRVVAELIERRERCDYASNVIRRTYPRGVDTEAMWMDAFERMERLATSTRAREHVTTFVLRERPDLFLRHSVELEDEDHSAHDWSVDTAADLKLIRRLIDALGAADRPVSWRAVLEQADAWVR
jgi:spore coat polysaccharide biosynthesis protein SpsF